MTSVEVFLLSLGLRSLYLSKAGVLGIHDLHTTTTLALQAKRLRMVLNQENNLWVRIVTGKYGRLSSWQQGHIVQVNWCWHLLLRVLSSLRAGFVVVIGNGMDVNLLN